MISPAFASSLPFFRRAIAPRTCRAIMSAPVALDAPAHSVAGVRPVFAQTMLRVTDAKKSVSFYENLGLRFLTSLDFPEYTFSLYFLSAPDGTTPPLPGDDASRAERAQWLWGLRCPTLELTHNWPGGEPETYVSGNEEPRGYGHLAIVGGNNMGDAQVASGATALPGEDGEVVTDPDGYAVKVIGGEGGAVFARTMLRVNDAVKSVRFFEHLGMRRICRIDSNGTSHFFLAYVDEDTAIPADNATAEECGKWLATFGAPMIHLRHEQGGEKLVNGNEKPNRGFGHVGIIVDDIHDVAKHMEELGYGIVRKPSPFLDVGEIAFVKDNDVGYWVELIARHGKAADKAYVKT